LQLELNVEKIKPASNVLHLLVLKMSQHLMLIQIEMDLWLVCNT